MIDKFLASHLSMQQAILLTDKRNARYQLQYYTIELATFFVIKYDKYILKRNINNLLKWELRNNSLNISN